MYWGELGQYHGRWCPCIARASAVVYEWPVIPSFDALIVAGQNKLLKKTFELPMIWGTMTLMWRHCNVIYWCKICMFVLLKHCLISYIVPKYMFWRVFLLAGLYLFLPANLSHPVVSHQIAHNHCDIFWKLGHLVSGSGEISLLTPPNAQDANQMVHASIINIPI